MVLLLENSYKRIKANMLWFSFMAMLSFPLMNSSLFVDSYGSPAWFGFFFSTSVFCMLGTFKMMRSQRTILLRITLVDIAFFLWLFFQLSHTLLSHQSFESLDFLLLCLGMFWLLAKLMDDFWTEKAYRRFITWIVVLAFIECMIGLMQSFDLAKNSWVSGTFGNSGPYAIYLSSILPLLLFATSCPSLAQYKKVILLLVAVFILVMIVIAQSRTSWISCFAVLAFFMNYRFHLVKRLKEFLKSPLSRIIAGVVVISLIASAIFMLYSLKEDSANGRLFIWEICLSIMNDNPLLGTGCDTFRQVYPTYQIQYFVENPTDSQNGWLAGNITHPFNEFLKVAVELGLLGLFVFALFIAVVWQTAISALQRKPEAMIFGFLSGFAVILVSCLFSYPLAQPITFFLFYFYAFAITKHAPTLKTITFSHRYQWFLVVIGILITFSCWSKFHQFQSELKWKNLTGSMLEDTKLDLRTQYEQLYPELKYNSDFLYNYGAYLSLKGHYNDAITILEESKKMRVSTEVLNYIGGSYLGLGDHLKAEKYFLQSSQLIPHKLYPKYQLARIYAATNRDAAAKNLAREIINAEVKVSSYMTDQIQSEMKTLLSSE